MWTVKLQQKSCSHEDLNYKSTWVCHDAVWQARVLKSGWSHLRPLGGASTYMDGAEVARLWMANGIPMCWRDIYFAASAVNSLHQTWIVNGSISIDVRALYVVGGGEGEDDFEIPHLEAGDPEKFEVKGSKLTFGTPVLTRLDLCEGYPVIAPLLDPPVRAWIDDNDPSMFCLEHGKPWDSKFIAATEPQAAAMVQKIELTSKFVHEESLFNHEQRKKMETLIDNEGWGGDDGERFVRLYDAVEAFGLKWEQPAYFVEHPMVE